MNLEHEPPHIARALLSVSRDGDTWSPVCAEMLPEHAAVRVTPQRQRGREERCGGERFARASKRRVCMSYGATETNEREEERDCPTLLEMYRRSRARRPSLTSRAQIQSLAGNVLEALGRNDLRPLLDGGWVLVRMAFAPWIDEPAIQAIVRGDPCDREFRRKQAGGPRAPFASVASVLSAASGGGVLGMGAITFDRHAANKGRTRANWNEIECKETRSMSGSVKSLTAIEREADATRGLQRANLTSAEMRGILDAAAKLPLEDRLLAYRAEVMGWTWNPSPKAIMRVGEVEARSRAMQEARKEILAATSSITDDQIREAIKRAKKTAETSLRALPLAGKMALRQGRKYLVADESQLHGLIPPRDDRKRKEART